MVIMFCHIRYKLVILNNQVAIMRRNGILFILFLIFSIGILSSFSNDNSGPHPYSFTYPELFGKPNLPADNPLTIEGVWLGRLLFYDTLLSINGKMSCGTCHLQELSFTDGRATAIGVHGDTLKRNTMSLVNLAWGQRFFWDGRAMTLEDLVKEPLANTAEMGGLNEQDLVRHLKEHPYYPLLFKKAFPEEEISLNTISKAIAQFMRTIVTKIHVTPDDDPKTNGLVLDINKDSVMLNENSFIGSIARISLMQCKSCHLTEAFGGQIVTKDEHDSLFKPTSFMNLQYSAPYFHDGRFKTLKEVMQFYNDNMETLQIKNPDRLIHQKERIKFNQYDMEHADEIFEVFRDSTILSNPAFSNPFKQKDFNWDGNKK